MTKPSPEQLKEWSGEGMNTRPRPMNLDSIQLNGQKGNFVIRRLQGHRKGEEVKKETAGDTVELVFLRVRRRLAQFRKDLDTLQTNEHNHFSEVVTLFGNPKPEVAVSQALKERYPLLKTEQIVYSLTVPGEDIVRFNIRGASLASSVQVKGVTKFYDYLSSFDKEEHIYEYVTGVTIVEEKGELGSYYAMNFTRGRRLNEVEMEKVYASLESVGESIKELDEYYKARPTVAKSSEVAEEEKASEVDGDQTPSEGINPDDIPF